MLRKRGHLPSSLKGQSISKQLVFSCKKGWGDRPVINLKVLNSFIFYSHFKLEGLYLLKDLLRENDFMCKVDLKDAYFCVPLDRNHQKNCDFNWMETFANSYVYVSDIAKLLKITLQFWDGSNQNNHLSEQYVADESDYKHSRNSQEYIDFSVAESRFCNKFAEICSGALAKDNASRSGNRLGENGINTITGKSRKVENKISKAYFKSKNDVMGNDQPFRPSTAQAVLPAMLQIRFFQQQQIAAISVSSYQSAMYLNQCSIQELQWWFNNLQSFCGKLISPTSKTVMQSDASKKGWRVYCQKVSIRGQWSL